MCETDQLHQLFIAMRKLEIYKWSWHYSYILWQWKPTWVTRNGSTNCVAVIFAACLHGGLHREDLVIDSIAQ